MPLEFRRYRDGTLRPTFFGRYRDKHQQLRCVNLRVPIRGSPPKTLHGLGNKDFEESRREAKERLAELIDEGRTARNAQYWAEKVLALKTGADITSTPLVEFPEKAWPAMRHRKMQASEGFREYVQGTLRRFVEFLQATYPKVKETAAIRAPHVRAFMEHERSTRKVSARTYNGTLAVLKSAFRYMEPGGDAFTGYLMHATGHEADTVHREPFKPDEVQAILAAAAGDPMMRGLIVTALCTAMRRGDCALLRWESVDLAAGYITVKTRKTGETADIPIISPLLEELAGMTQGESPYVFPEAAAMYASNPDGLNWRLREIMARAGFVDDRTARRIEAQKKHPAPVLPAADAGEVARRGAEWIGAAAVTEGKRLRLRAVFEAYTAGQSMAAIAREMGLSKGCVCGLLTEVERGIRLAVVRRPPPVPIMVPAVVRGVTQTSGHGQRKRLASVKGWHSFRTTFITLALADGVPIELVRRVTGHTSVETLLRFYFRPDREQVRRAIMAAMPHALNGGGKPPLEEAREIVAGMKPKTLAADRERVLALLAKVR